VKGSELLRVIGAQVCLHATMAGMRLATPLLALQQGYSAAAVGVLISLFALTQVFLALPAGRFADRHGFKRPLWLSVIAAVVGAGLVAIFPVFPVMCLAALLTGGATGATVIALQRHVGRSAHQHRRSSSACSAGSPSPRPWPTSSARFWPAC
jgi:MFS family permease